MIIVVNKKMWKGNAAELGLLPIEIALLNGIHAEYIGRNDGGTLLQNNYHIGKDGTRSEVIEKYRIWLQWRMESDPKIVEYLEALAALHRHGMLVVLLCHCKPADCHGDVVKKILESM